MASNVNMGNGLEAKNQFEATLKVNQEQTPE